MWQKQWSEIDTFLQDSNVSDLVFAFQVVNSNQLLFYERIRSSIVFHDDFRNFHLYEALSSRGLSYTLNPANLDTNQSIFISDSFGAAVLAADHKR